MALPIAVALIRPLGAALTVSGTAQSFSFRTHQGMDERGQQLAQHVGVTGSESFGQHGGQVDIVGTGHRVDSFARVTLDGLSKNHAMTFNHSATTRRYRSSGPTRTPLCWTQPVASVAGLCPVTNQPIPEIALYSGDNALVSVRGTPAAVMVTALTLVGQRQWCG
jgi:hypothetical protein